MRFSPAGSRNWLADNRDRACAARDGVYPVACAACHACERCSAHAHVSVQAQKCDRAKLDEIGPGIVTRCRWNVRGLDAVLSDE